MTKFSTDHDRIREFHIALDNYWLYQSIIRYKPKTNMIAFNSIWVIWFGASDSRVKSGWETLDPNLCGIHTHHVNNILWSVGFVWNSHYRWFFISFPFLILNCWNFDILRGRERILRSVLLSLNAYFSSVLQPKCVAILLYYEVDG